jgi:lysophospholipase L1-like esterase
MAQYRWRLSLTYLSKGYTSKRFKPVTVHLTTKKKIVYWSILVILSVSSSLGVAETLLHLFPSESYSRGFLPEHPYKFDPYVGWIHKSNFAGTYVKDEFKVQFVTNSEGFRSDSEFISGDSDNKVIAVLGDSFVEALQVSEEATFPKVLEARLRERGIAQVQNYGVSNTGIVHYLQMYRYYASKHRPTFVIICIQPQNDFRNSSPTLEPAGELHPRYLLDNRGEVAEVLPFMQADVDSPGRTLARGVKYFLEQYSALYRLADFLEKRAELQEINSFPLDAYIYEEPWNKDFQEAWKYSSWALRQLIDAVRNDSAIPIVVLVPGSWTTSDKAWNSLEELYEGSGGKGRLDRDKTSRQIRELCGTMGVDFLDLTAEFREAYASGKMPHWEKDGHLTPLGHQIVADEILKELLGCITGGKCQ